MSSTPSRLTVVSSGNEELDTRLGGGLPFPSLVIIEGDNGTGKTTLCTQFTLGLLNSGKRVLFITTENSVKGFLEQARNVSLDLTDYFLKGLLYIVPAHLEGIEWSNEKVRKLISVLIDFLKGQQERFEAFIVDSISIIASYVGEKDLHKLITEFRNIVKNGRMIIVTIHSAIINPPIMKELISVADVYFKLIFAEVGGRSVKALNIVKIRGAPTIAETLVAFDVDPAFGIKIIPVALAKA